MSTLLVTGGAGYIGSHTIVELLAAGHAVVCIDNYVNSSPVALQRLQEITGRSVVAIEGDVRDAALLERTFASHRIDAVIHFAALKSVGESVARPLDYYDANVGGTIALLQAMQRANVTRFVFSSSATVYGKPDALPIPEDAPIRTTNPYGGTKAVVEQILRDVALANPGWSIASLRYFNPIGAHESGRIGEDPHDVPNNIFPFLCQVAIGKRSHLSIFGSDWPTVDGTGVRDYLHVTDLAIGHVRAFEYGLTHDGWIAINLGTGHGTSVLELVEAFEKAVGKPIPRTMGPRRPGDIAACWADSALAERLLGWRAQRTVQDACADGWRWQQKNPNGYRAA
jgi:UDP-glucose 4-epimerase